MNNYEEINIYNDDLQTLLQPLKQEFAELFPGLAQPSPGEWHEWLLEKYGIYSVFEHKKLNGGLGYHSGTWFFPKQVATALRLRN